MELQARLPFSALLLSVVFVGLSASPLPTNLLSRLRRSAGTTAAAPTGTDPTVGASGVPTTAELEASVSTVTASPSARVVRQASIDDVFSRHYAFLHVHTIDVAREHRGLYSDYKRERFADNPDPIIRDMGLSYRYLPSVNDLSDEGIRAALPDSELVTVHYNNLIIFRDTLGRVRDSETLDISQRVGAVIQRLRSVINRIETTMILQGQEDNIISVESSIPEFHSDVTNEERNTRTLLVLQQFHWYIPHVRRDFRILTNRHQ